MTQEKMNFFYMIIIITALATAALAKGAMECNLSESTGAQQCFGAHGKPLIFYLPNSTNKQTTLTNNTHNILKVTNNTKGVISSEYGSRSALFTNGTFKLDKVTKRDSGDYLLEVYGLTNGELLNKINIHLEIQAPVSQPAVSQTCLSPEQMKVSCSSEGGEDFILTLDGNVLIQTRAGSTDQQLKPSVSNVTISLHGQLTGGLVCTVGNNVSREQTVVHLASCKETICHFRVVAVRAVVVSLLLLVLCLVIYHLHKRARPKTDS